MATAGCVAPFPPALYAGYATRRPGEVIETRRGVVDDLEPATATAAKPDDDLRSGITIEVADRWPDLAIRRVVGGHATWIQRSSA